MGETVNLSFCGTSYPAHAGDWKGLFLQQMLFALARRPELRLACWLPPGEIPGSASRFGTKADEAWLGRLLSKGGIAQALRRPSPANVRAPFELLYRLRRAYRDAPGEFDVHHVNWLQNCLALPPDGRPAVVTALGTDMKLLGVPGVVPLLRRCFSRRRVVLCPNAPWMAGRLADCFGDLCRIEPVPFGIDARWFGIERTWDEDSVWLVVSRVTRGKIGDLLSWGRPLFEGGSRRLVLIGPMQDRIELPDWVDYRGPADAATLSRDWFPRVRGLVTLSRHPEGRPQVMLEAAASGLPIVASDISAHLDLASEDCPLRIVGTPEAFAGSIEALEDRYRNEEEGASMRRWARDTAGTWDVAADRFARLYRELGEEAPR